MDNLEITVFDKKVRVIKVDGADYFCITDLAKFRDTDRADVPIRSWINTKRELEFLYEWEIKHNTNFKHTTDSVFKGYNSYLAEVFIKNQSSPSKWVAYTNATGFVIKRGKYGGTYAHSTIALNFANYIHPKFYVELLEEYQDIKKQQLLAVGDPFDVKRHLTAGNYSILVASLFSKIDERLLTHPQPYKSRLPFAAEADMINTIVFKQTAKEWRLDNPDKPKDRNMRDYASVLDLVILNNLEFLDAMLLQWDVEDLEERRKFLMEAYDFIHPVLKRSKTIDKLQDLTSQLANRSLK